MSVVIMSDIYLRTGQIQRPQLRQLEVSCSLSKLYNRLVIRPQAADVIYSRSHVTERSWLTPFFSTSSSFHGVSLNSRDCDG